MAHYELSRGDVEILRRLIRGRIKKLESLSVPAETGIEKYRDLLNKLPRYKASKV